MRLLPVGVTHFRPVSWSLVPMTPVSSVLKALLPDAGLGSLHCSDCFCDVLGIESETADDAAQCCVRRGDQWVWAIRDVEHESTRLFYDDAIFALMGGLHE